MNQELTGKQKRHLRGLANRMDASIVIGHSGINDNCLNSIEGALTKEELVKIRIQPSSGLDRKEAGSKLAGQTESSLVQTFGNTVLLYRRNAVENKIKLP